MNWSNYDPTKFAWLNDRAYNLYTQEGADGILEAIFERVGETNRYCCELGAADGLWFSNTRRLIEKGWGGLLIEGSSESYQALERRYADNPTVATMNAWVQPRGENSIESLLDKVNAPKDLDLLVIDIDGQDYYVLNSLSKYRPRVIVCEYDATAGPMFIPELGGIGQAGEMAIVHAANARGYMPACKTPYNLILVRDDLIDLVADKNAIPSAGNAENWEEATNAFLKDARGVVHVGANTGQERDIYAALGLPVIWVEALPAEYAELAANIAHYRGQRGLNYLLTDEDGKEYDFHIAENDGQSSSVFDFADHKKIWPHIDMIGSIRLKSATFQTMVEYEKVDLAGYDALVMDVQGAELLVLKGMGDLIDGFKFIRCEAADFEIYKDCCELDDLDEYLGGRGFTRTKTWQGANRPDVGSTYEALYAKRAKEEDLVKLCAVMSTPRIGFLSTMDCVFAVMASLNSGFVRTEGVFWNHSLTRGIENAIEKGANYILTIDFDSLFTVDDVKRLVCHLYDNPDVDIIVPIQMKREGGEALISTDGEVDLRHPLVPIRQGHFGLTMFRAGLFEKIPKPWLREVPDEDGRWGDGRLDPDMFFWQICRENGIKAVAALDVVIGHLEQVVTWPNQAFQAFHQTIIDWRKLGKPSSAFIKPPADAVAQAAAMSMKQ